MSGVFPKDSHPGNWMEDSCSSIGDNLYMNKCTICDTAFLGHKRRFVCKVCDKELVAKEGMRLATFSDAMSKTEKNMGGPIANVALKESVAAHIAASLGIDPHNAVEMDGAMAIATAALDYFVSSTRGAPVNSGQTMQWAIFSALWENKVPQEEIDEFFTMVDNDPGRLIQMWRSLPAEQRKGKHSVVIIPGTLTDADISAVTASLFHNRGDAASTPNTTPPSEA